MTDAWQDYYRHWGAMTRDKLDPRLLEIAEPLARLCLPAHILDKAVYLLSIRAWRRLCVGRESEP